MMELIYSQVTNPQKSKDFRAHGVSSVLQSTLAGEITQCAYYVDC